MGKYLEKLVDFPIARKYNNRIFAALRGLLPKLRCFARSHSGDYHKTEMMTT